MRERIRYLHDSLSTEKAHLHWVRFFIRWHGRIGEMRHPHDMGAAEVGAFLNMLADERIVSAPIHPTHQSLNTGTRFSMLAVMASIRSSLCSMAAFQVAM